MNRSSSTAVKHNSPHAAMHEHGTATDEPDYDAIEAAVMQTARGRWFLSEYLRRHQNDETRRLAAALRRLATAQERLLTPARENAALDGIRLLLARTADELSLPGEERTLPESAAGRLRELLAEAARDPHRAAAACATLSGCFAQLASILGEPVPHADPLPRGAAAAEAASTPLASVSAADADQTQNAHSAAVEPVSSGEAAGTETGVELPTRIVIRRHPRSGEVDIPLPEKEERGKPSPRKDGGASTKEEKGGMAGRVRLHAKR